MVDARKVVIIFVVAILFSILVFSVIEAVYPNPKYEDFCKDNFRSMPVIKESQNCTVIPIAEADQNDCMQRNGYIDYNYDSTGCATSYECNTCQNEYQQEQDKHNVYVFYISAILALIAIFIGLYLPSEANTLNEWIGTGFMLGGAFTLFFGTATSYMALDRLIRPIVIFLELILVIFISYRKIGNMRKK